MYLTASMSAAKRDLHIASMSDSELGIAVTGRVVVVPKLVPPGNWERIVEEDPKGGRAVVGSKRGEKGAPEVGLEEPVEPDTGERVVVPVHLGVVPVTEDAEVVRFHPDQAGGVQVPPVPGALVVVGPVELEGTQVQTIGVALGVWVTVGYCVKGRGVVVEANGNPVELLGRVVVIEPFPRPGMVQFSEGKVGKTTVPLPGRVQLSPGIVPGRVQFSPGRVQLRGGKVGKTMVPLVPLVLGMGQCRGGNVGKTTVLFRVPLPQGMVRLSCGKGGMVMDPLAVRFRPGMVQLKAGNVGKVRVPLWVLLAQGRVQFRGG